MVEIPVYLRSTSPVERTYTSHEFHSYSVGHVTRAPLLRLGMGAQFALFARNRVPRGAIERDPRIEAPIPLSRLSLRLASGAEDFWHVLDEGSVGYASDGWRGSSVDVDPGVYVLRWIGPRWQQDRTWVNPHRVIEQAL